MEREQYTAVAERVFPAPAEKVWDALATGEGFSLLYEGLSVECDWRIGSPIVWNGEWQGTKFRDEGTLKVYDRPRLFEYTYWSSFWGPEPKTEDVQTIRNEFIPTEGGTKVVITQMNISSAESRDHSAANWKELLEKAASALTAES